MLLLFLRAHGCADLASLTDTGQKANPSPCGIPLKHCEDVTVGSNILTYLGQELESMAVAYVMPV
jgi:hypothetical protein